MAENALIFDTNIENIFQSQVTLSEEQWLIHSKNDLILSAESALESKLIHEISEFNIPQGTKIFII